MEFELNLNAGARVVEPEPELAKDWSGSQIFGRGVGARAVSAYN